ncbi:septation protein SepH [Microbacterium betulae]|uniref:Septation protein SepH n=1 Tax=Microbacterium betulae TaxID=2981139 RepID=A0AA97FNA5_9MICO|nr:septation protein SepH [Microbacterium sp. AB]WOF24517.1 septation protein SepH [Microbacterium sp. AB]
MDQLTIVGTEDGKLVLASESGQRYTLPVDDLLRSEIRRIDRAAHREESRTPAPRPKEIQEHIRAGLSSEEVAELLSARVEDVRRFEGPVLAEREHIVGRALAVPVLMGVDLTGEQNPTFGEAIRSKLADIDATRERWTSWKDETGWIVKVEFTAAEVDHDARWSFDPRRSALAPLNADATQLSRQGPMPDGLIPRLRALDVAPAEDDERFDSGAFGPRRAPDADDAADGFTRSIPSVREAATKRAPSTEAPNPDTADLLEALRRRRGQRETAPVLEPEAETGEPEEPAPAPVALFDALEPGYATGQEEGSDETRPPQQQEESDSPRRRGRASMPSWDEIVFGARADD